MLIPSGDKSASFIALVGQWKQKLVLQKKDNLPHNITLTREHVDHATAHIDTNTTKELAEKIKELQMT